MRTTIKTISDNRVSLKYEDLWTGEIVEMDIWAPPEGGYVLDGQWQICRRLSKMGSTLHWSGKYPLVDLVRREYAAMRRKDRREIDRVGGMSPAFFKTMDVIEERTSRDRESVVERLKRGDK